MNKKLPTGPDFAALDTAHDAAKTYLESLDQRAVYPSQQAIAALNSFDEALPGQGTDPTAVVQLLDQLGSPATTAQMGGRYFGFVNGGALPATLAVRLLSSAWDQNPALNVMSPIASTLEQVCERWLNELFDLPRSTALGLVTGTSMSLACGFVAARNELLRRQGWDAVSNGLFGAPPIRVIVGEAAHSTVWKALSFIGMGKDRVEKVPCDDQGRMQTNQIPGLDRNCLLILSAGNVNTGAFDNFATIMPEAQAAGAWTHIDGAFGLWAVAAQQTRHLCQGIEVADSWSCDAHKTLNTPYDCGLILCKDRRALIAAMQAQGTYIQWAEDNSRDSMLYTPDMSRRARGVELWAALKSLGREGVDALITQLCDRAQQFATALAAEGYQILNDVVFNQVAVCLENDEQTLRALSYIQNDGKCWVSGAKLNDRTIIRVSVCSYRTTPNDVKRSVHSFAAAKEKAQRS